MKLSHEEIAARLAASPEHDVCVLRIEEGDFGCEDHRDPPRLWLRTETAAGERRSLELPEPRVEALGLAEGYTCCFADLHP